jgi:hypothetical protein
MNLDSKIKEALARHETDVQPRPGAWSGVEKTIARRHKTRVAFTVAGITMAVAATVVAIPRLGSNPKPFDTFPTASQKPAQTKPRQPRLIGKVPARVFALAVGSNSLWGLESNANPSATQRSLIRIDPSVRKIMGRIPVGYVPQAVAADDKAIWVTNGSGCMAIVSCADASSPPGFRFPYQNSVMRIDPRTNKVVASIRVTEPQDVAIGFGSVWVTAKNGTTSTVVRIDPTTNKIVKNIFVGGSGFSSLAAGDRFLWVVNDYKKDGSTEVSEVRRVDPQTNTVAYGVFVDQFEAKIASGFGATWVTTSGTDSASGIRMIDPASGRIVARITLPDAAPIGLNAVTTGEGFVWAVSARGYLWKVDPVTHLHDDPTTVGAHPPTSAEDVVTGFGFAWVASGDGQIWQYAP